MRSTIFNPPLELAIDINGESFTQSQSLEGSLVIKSHAPTEMTLDDMKVLLALGNLKKLKTKDPKTFEVLEEVNLGPLTIAGNGEVEKSFSFSLKADAPISSKKESPFLLFGSQSEIMERGHLQIPVTVHPMTQEIINIFETFFRFKVKEFKNTKDLTEVVFTPPASSKDFSSLDSFSCLFKYDTEALKLKYVYKLRVLATDEGGAKVDKKKKEVSFEILHKDYQMSPGFIDQERAKNHIESSLEELKSKKLF